MKLLAIRNYLKKHSINISTSLGDNEEFDNISTLSNANHNDLTFFHNQKYINFLKCRIELLRPSYESVIDLCAMVYLISVNRK